MGKSKLCASIVIGAVVGAAISMLDRTTREKTIETSKKIAKTISYYAANHEELQQLIQEKVEDAQLLYDNVTENVDLLVEKAEEIKDIPSTIQNMIDDTKSAFSSSDK